MAGGGSLVESVPSMSLLTISDHHYDGGDDEQKSIVVAASSSAPIVSSYNDRIRPLLDTVDRLRHLKIMEEGIQLPTIVVVGDQSSGKSSVLESLAGISLPRGQGICTRVPLIMRLQNHPNPNPELLLEFAGKTVPTDEEHISDAISLATEEIAGNGKGISSNPLTLIVKKNGVPDLTMIDLPGITRVPVHGQPEDIYEQISKIIMEFITPEESIILNVLSDVMSQKVDKTGQRTLAVVTKADKSPEGLLEKVIADDVSIGLGYVCVMNRIGDESYEVARAEEAKLFDSHCLLSKIEKSMVGVPVLAERLVGIQANIMVKCLPEIVRKINEKLAGNIEELNKLPKHLNSVGEAMAAFMLVVVSAKISLRKILLQGEFDECPDAKEMHGTARVVKMLNKFSADLQSANANASGKYLLDEIMVLEEGKSIGLPNFLPKVAFHTLLQRKVKSISAIPFEFVEKIWGFVENVLISVLLRHSKNYPQLVPSTKRAAQNLVAKMKQESVDWVNDIVDMEKVSDYTCDPTYTSSWKERMSSQEELMQDIRHNWTEFGNFNIVHLPSMKSSVREAFDLGTRVDAYWKIVLRRMSEIVNEIMGSHGNGLERMMDESPSVAIKRNKLRKSIALLKESKNVVANIIDKISDNFDY
ncbi:hypothetical protein ABFS83_01G068200 [Erythranthe nasuta]